MLDQLIIKKRQEKGLTQLQLAQSCNLSLKTIYNVENNIGSIKFNTILNICSILHIKVNFD